MSKSTQDLLIGGLSLSPPWQKCGKKLESLCRKALFDFSLIPSGEKHIGVALSGGKDSVSTLILLKAISGKGFPPFRITAIHVDGAFSCGPGLSKNYIQQICSSLEIPLLIKHSTQTIEKLSCYPCSRERRSLLFQAAKEAGISTIAFGHHRDDSIETLLLNLLHKGEFAANLAKVPMQKYGVTIIRPLIYASEQEILTFAKQQNFARIMCGCPIGAKSKRRDVKKILETLEEVFPNTRQNLAYAALRSGEKKALSPEKAPPLPILDTEFSLEH